MAAFVIADVLPADMEGYRESGYLEAAVASAAVHGGVYRARGGQSVVLEGDWDPDRVVIVEFPSMEAVMTWYNSDEYQPWVEVRRKYAPNSKIVAVEGVST